MDPAPDRRGSSPEPDAEMRSTRRNLIALGLVFGLLAVLAAWGVAARLLR